MMCHALIPAERMFMVRHLCVKGYVHNKSTYSKHYVAINALHYNYPVGQVIEYYAVRWFGCKFPLHIICWLNHPHSCANHMVLLHSVYVILIDSWGHAIMILATFLRFDLSRRWMMVIRLYLAETMLWSIISHVMVNVDRNIDTCAMIIFRWQQPVLQYILLYVYTFNTNF